MDGTFLASLFETESTVSVALQSSTQTNTSGVMGPKTWTTYQTVTGIFWRGGMAKSLVSEKLKPDVSGTLILRPSEISRSSIVVPGRAVISSVGTFDIIFADDIAMQNEVIILPLKEYT